MTGRGSRGSLYDEVAAILERHDPMGLMPADLDAELGPQDEYDPEATTITARLVAATTLEDVHRIVAEEFARWFDVGEAPAEQLTAVSDDIWAAVQARSVGSG